MSPNEACRLLESWASRRSDRLTRPFDGRRRRRRRRHRRITSPRPTHSPLGSTAAAPRGGLLRPPPLPVCLPSPVVSHADAGAVELEPAAEPVPEAEVSLCVKGVCSNFLCDLKLGSDVNITGPVGKEMLMPKDPNATIIMLANGSGIAPFRSFLWKMFFEKYDDYKFNGLGWLFLGVPTSSSLLYQEEFDKMKKKAPDNFQVDYAISREQTNADGEKMYVQTRMAEYKEELWELLKKDNTYAFHCFKILELRVVNLCLISMSGIDWLDYKKQQKAEQWNVEVY